MYRQRLATAADRLVTFPELGEERTLVFPGCRALEVEQHVLFYRVADDDIIIGRVLHVRQDVAAIRSF